jgi:DNA modification methylase
LSIPTLNSCHFGDVLGILPAWPDAFIQTVVTSPPYLWLRQYGINPTAWPTVNYAPMPGLSPIHIPSETVCLGDERIPAAFIGHLVHLFREIRRVLRDDGTVWLNLGATYFGSFGAKGAQGPLGDVSDRAACEEREAASESAKPRTAPKGTGFKEKDLIGIPWMAAHALQADGWYLRSDVIWHKPNPMPSSVNDRLTTAHEYIFLLSKKERYFFDAEAIREIDSGHSSGNGFKGRQGTAEYHARSGGAGTDNQWEPGGGRNKRSVWTVASFPYKEAHFATFPPKLIQPCILAGTPAAGCCPTCRKPWKLETEKEFVPQADVSPEKGIRGAGTQKPMDASNGNQGYPRGTSRTVSAEWVQACACPPLAPIPSIVFDPFLGSGTVGEQAQAYGRSWLGCEMNPDNELLQAKRTQKISLL